MISSTNNSVADFLTLAAHQQHGSFGNLTLLTFNATLGAIILDPSVTNVSVLSPAIGDLFAEDVFSIPQACAFPISGQYGFLNRLLYYVMILFAVLAASNSWLCWAALGIAMSYSAGACLHAFALFTRYRYDWPEYDSTQWYASMIPKYYGDIDLQGIFPILVAGCIALPPILNWSYLVKGSRGAKPVIILWSAMMFAAAIPGLVFTIRGIYPFEVTNQVTYCPTNAAIGCTFAELFNDGLGISSSTTYDRCQCNDTCGTVSPKGFPFRHGQTLQAVLTSDRSTNLGEKSSVFYAFVVNFLFLFFILAHGILGLIEASWSQQHIRDTIFRWLSGTTRRSFRRGIISTARYYVGKCTAAFFFISAIVMTVLCPPLFISSVIINEIVTWNWPVAEEFDAVGQWGPIVAALFAIVAATVQAISIAWEDRKRSAKSNNPVSDIVQKKRNSIIDLWSAARATLHEFKYWFLEGSLHEPLQRHHEPEEEGEDGGAVYPATMTPHHRTFKQVQPLDFLCDKCKNPTRLIEYQCVDCDQGYCTACWPRVQKRGARLDDTFGEETEERSSKGHAVVVRVGRVGSSHSNASSNSSSKTSLMQMQKPTEYLPLQQIEDGSFSLSLWNHEPAPSLA